MNKIDEQQLDRLVDGELNEDDRRRLLESFDRNLDGWRQCACAFLEAQEFRGALDGYEDGESQPLASLPSSGRETTCTRQHAAARNSSSAGWWPALAACLVIGFGIGQLGSDGGSGRQPAVASDSPSNLAPNDPSQLLVSNDSGTIAGHDPLGESILEQQYSAIPSDIEDVLDRLGQRVERRQVFLPVQSGDGRPGTVPVEEIEIVPVRWDTY